MHISVSDGGPQILSSWSPLYFNLDKSGARQALGSSITIRRMVHDQGYINRLCPACCPTSINLVTLNPIWLTTLASQPKE